MFNANSKNDDEIDIDGPITMIRGNVCTLEDLTTNTNFSKKELKMLYQGFKQECPTGYCSEDEFIGIFVSYFPQGDATKYAHLVFNTFEPNQNPGYLNFEQFVTVLSVLSRGAPKEQLNWIFNLYDIDRDGYISKPEMYALTSAIHEMLGDYTVPLNDIRTPKEHVDKFFHQIDIDKDGLISYEEFVIWCQNDPKRIDGLRRFDTVI